jgi:hypothetical protein
MIDHIMYGGMVLVEDTEKAHAVFEHFNEIMGHYVDRGHDLEFDFLAPQS